VSRGDDEILYNQANIIYLEMLLDYIEQNKLQVNFVQASTIQVLKPTKYGISKKRAEEMLANFTLNTNNNVYIFRILNVFGAAALPNYSSVIATFAYNLLHDLPCQINPDQSALDYVYIDDLVIDFLAVIKNPVISNSNSLVTLSVTYRKTVHEILKLLIYFSKNKINQEFYPKASFEAKL